MIGSPVQFTTAGGAQSIAPGETIISGVILTPAGAVATCDIRKGGAGGTIRLSL